MTAKRGTDQASDDKIGAAARETKGSVQEAIGKLIGDDAARERGAAEKQAGAAEQEAGTAETDDGAER